MPDLRGIWPGYPGIRRREVVLSEMSIKTKYRWLEFEEVEKYCYWRCKRVRPTILIGLVVYSDACKQWHFDVQTGFMMSRHELQTVANFIGQLNKLERNQTHGKDDEQAE